MATAAAKTSYAKTLTIVGLAGSALGSVIGVGVSKSLTGVLTGLGIGGAGSLLLYGVWLRMGGPDLWRNPCVPEQDATFAGLPLWARESVIVGADRPFVVH